MMISTKGRYALRVLTALAEQNSEEYIPLKVISEDQQISQKYLESIMGMLSKAGLVKGIHGKGGGYKLSRPPEECRLGDILRVTEGSLAPVACLQDNAETCDIAPRCRTLKMWKDLDETIGAFFDSRTIRDLMEPGTPDDEQK